MTPEQEQALEQVAGPLTPEDRAFANAILKECARAEESHIDGMVRHVRGDAATEALKNNNSFNKIGVAELSIEAGDLHAGQKLLITGKTTGTLNFTADAIRLDGQSVDFAPKGSIVSVSVPEKVRMNDLIYLLVERVFGQEAGNGEEL